MDKMICRGRRLDNQEWVEGYFAVLKWYLDEKPIAVIIPEDATLYPHGELCGFYPVDPETVGRFTSLTDKNREKIFEGDIVDILTENEEIGVVAYEDGGFLVNADGFCVDFHSNINGTDLEVIGNIHDNPELTKGE